MFTMALNTTVPSNSALFKCIEGRFQTSRLLESYSQVSIFHRGGPKLCRTVDSSGLKLPFPDVGYATSAKKLGGVGGGEGVMHVKKVQHIEHFWDTDNNTEQNY